MNYEFTDYALDKIKYSVRASQAILQYGVGAMVDFQEQTLMTAAPDTWKNTTVIHDERLEKKLNVTQFRGFTDDSENPFVTYARFPRWYFCPKCRRFCDIDEWKNLYNKYASKQKKETDPDMVKNLRCPICNVPLVVSRIVSICPEGHIDDFPWIKWVHAKSKKNICGNKILELRTNNGSTDGLEGIVVRCSCGAYSSLKGAFGNTSDGIKPFENLDKDTDSIYNFKCTGFHPWKNEHENCSEYPVASQRGSSSVYFPYIISSIIIPPYSGTITKNIENSRHFENFFEVIKTTKETLKSIACNEYIISEKIEEKVCEFAESISKEIRSDPETVKSVLKRKLENHPDNENSNVRYRYEEYTALKGEAKVKNDKKSDFIREETDIRKYNLPYITNISLIHKIKEVRVLKGFTRCKIVEKSMDSKNSGNIVDIKPENESWYPAYEVRGEGIFIEFDDKAITSWINKNPVVTERANAINKKFHESFFGENSNKKITAKFMLLHTISHLIIKEMSFYCGYNIASLQERLYCAEKKNDAVDMQGILIYTACGDAEGTLGGLVRQGRADVFPKLFKKAIESAVLCSNDPVCCLSQGQGRDSLNYAACHTCTLIPETSCEENNVFLDRATVVGDFDNRDKGFYSSMIFSENKWAYKYIEPETDTDTAVPDKENQLKIVNYGTELSGISYYDIFRDLASDAENNEKINLDNILKHSKLSDCSEIPYENAEFYTSSGNNRYSCEIIWKNAKVMYFSECSEDDYNAAENSDWKCFYGASNEFDVEEFINAILKE